MVKEQLRRGDGRRTRQRGVSGRTALVLAAGYGIRHGASIIPKPLLGVAGRALILRALDGVELAGCSRAVVVLGHEEDQIRRFLEESYSGRGELVYVSNRRFDLGNGVSVLAARDHLPDEFLLAMADHVFEPSVMALIAEYSCRPDGATLVVDSKIDSIFDLADATKVVVKEGRVVQIGKELRSFNAVDCGLFLAGTALMDALQEILETRGDVSLTQGVRKLASSGRMEALDLGPRRWQDVDTREMLAAAERMLSSEHKPSDVRSV